VILKRALWPVGSCPSARISPVILTYVPLKGPRKETYVKITEQPDVKVQTSESPGS
jgi:hypothetical protein